LSELEASRKENESLKEALEEARRQIDQLTRYIFGKRSEPKAGARPEIDSRQAAPQGAKEP
jgi:hypothetical protein